jgi:hypothetical protein
MNHGSQNVKNISNDREIRKPYTQGGCKKRKVITETKQNGSLLTAAVLLSYFKYAILFNEISIFDKRTIFGMFCYFTAAIDYFTVLPDNHIHSEKHCVVEISIVG